MKSKRGMSPLIATMLLVALAVAIGTSFVSYVGLYIEKNSANSTIECKSYIVDLFELDRTKDACSQLKNPLAMKFWDSKKSASETECYISIASGTTRICNAQPLIMESTWAPSEDVKI